MQTRKAKGVVKAAKEEIGSRKAEKRVKLDHSSDKDLQ